MCFFQKLQGDYFRYAIEALEMNWYVKPEKVIVKKEEISVEQKKLMKEKAAIEAGIDIKDLKLNDQGDEIVEEEKLSPSALSR